MLEKKIMLIDPYDWQGAGGGNDPFPNTGIADMFHPLKKSGWQISFLDMKNQHFTEADVLSRIKEFRPDIIGFSCKTATYDFANALAKTVLDNVPKTYKIVYGGPQGDFVPTSMIFNFSHLNNKSGQTPSNGV